MNTITTLTKVQLALVDLARAKAAVAAMDKKIGEALAASMANFTEEECAQHDGKNKWLKLAYQQSYAGPYEGWYYTNHEDDIEGYLAENCEHALLAHQLIQQRKPLRKALGTAKRRVSLLATNLAKKAKP